MASRAGGVVQDQNLNFHFNETSVDWKTNVAKVLRKGGLGGRTPLGDLSNALKPSQNLASKKQNGSITEIERGASKNAFNATRKKSISKASGKAPAGGRKPLSDISNSGKLNLNEESKRSQNAKLKLRVVSEEPINVDAIPEEQFLHNHQECIKAQSKVMDLNQFLQTLGLDNDIIKQQTDPMPVMLKAESPPRLIEVEEMIEKLSEDEMWNDKLWSRSQLNSPPPCGTPKSPKLYMNHDCDFKLLDSP